MGIVTTSTINCMSYNNIYYRLCKTGDTISFTWLVGFPYQLSIISGLIRKYIANFR
jgi:hypothetical protein